MSKHTTLVDRAAHKTLSKIREEFEKHSWRLSANHIEREVIARMENQIASVFFALLGIEPNSLAKADDTAKYRLSGERSKISQMLQKLCEEKIQEWISANFDRLWDVHRDKLEKAMEGALLSKVSDSWHARQAVEKIAAHAVENLAVTVADKFMERYSKRIAELADEEESPKRKEAA